VTAVTDGYSPDMAYRSRTRVAVVAFVLIGVLIALWLLVRDLDDSSDVPEENGTTATFGSVR
jgi:hypothetical protein